MSFADIPEINFVDTDVNTLKNSVIKFAEASLNRTLGKADPLRLLLETLAYIINQQNVKINYAAKMNLLKYAEGDFLDNLGVLVGTDRLKASAATVTLEFTISAKQEYAVTIPAGTRVTTREKEMYFATDTSAIIAPRTMTCTVGATCMEAGTNGNDFPIGSIDTIVDPIPYVASVTNVTTSEGGSDIEKDTPYRERIHEAPESFASGTEGKYASLTKEVSSLIADVAVYNGGDGIACIVPLLEGGKLPGQELLQSITDYVSQKQYRYLTDKLVVKAPTEVNYNIDLTYYIDREDATTATAIQKAVDVAVDEYVKWQQKKLGRNVDPSELIYLLRAAGARKIAVNEPAYMEVAKDEIASAKNIAINFGGWEDE